ncbi:MAG: carbohydrate ABC transporter substrate-binding protein [Mesorhizobium sp.]|nr:MAG: carbohydrate ABC transporter substrate-binding protein [Mesorhizobium sp.]TIR32345.1 MAG: carbohydrate ABC transporter substrate-binding protein [Mesorhizobium sp.]TIS27789.1 MAG: carbohydrate ABC transporter substrate-binding protein [Mesorhizobium sp.]
MGECSMNSKDLRKTKRGVVIAAVAGLLSVGTAIASGKVEVMHWWTSGGEANALNVLKEALNSQSIAWEDSAVAGGSGTNALQVLQARVASGNPPAAMQMHGEQIKTYADEGLLGDLAEIATAQNWDVVMAPELQRFAKHDGVYVGVPFNEHRHNWMWVSKKIIDQYGGKVPATWDEWFTLADKMKADGVQPLAHGGQPWQEFMLWEDILVGVGGADFHKKAIQELDGASLESDKMVQVFDTFRKVLSYADAGAANRDWNLATAMVIEDKAAFHFMGDWAKGEFTVANKKADVDYLCLAAPGTAGTYVFLADYWGFFPVKDEAARQAQMQMARLTMDPAVQTEFNIRKGSIPARTDIDPKAFDACGQAAIADRAAAAEKGGVLPSLSQNHAQSREVRGVFEDVISSFANNTKLTSGDAVARLKSGLAGL